MHRWGLLLPNSLRPRIGQPPSNRFQLPWAEYTLLPSGAADITVQAWNLHLTTPHSPLPSQRLESLSTNTSPPQGESDTLQSIIFTSQGVPGKPRGVFSAPAWGRMAKRP